ncbi:hypothetical protein ZWY2020_012644 [Hordeum vulgare]|nr:hypothetical protein ZWY2020_012644 [Hordeum vulgare]
MPSTRVLLVAVILAAVASVQGHATAPAPSAVGQCTAEYISELRNCVDFRLGRVDLRNLANERKRCCRNVCGKPRATECLCAAFKRARDVIDRANFTGEVNAVLFICGEPRFPGLACPAFTSG